MYREGQRIDHLKIYVGFCQCLVLVKILQRDNMHGVAITVRSVMDLTDDTELWERYTLSMHDAVRCIFYVFSVPPTPFDRFVATNEIVCYLVYYIYMNQEFVVKGHINILFEYNTLVYSPSPPPPPPHGAAQYLYILMNT